MEQAAATLFFPSPSFSFLLTHKLPPVLGFHASRSAPCLSPIYPTRFANNYFPFLQLSSAQEVFQVEEDDRKETHDQNQEAKRRKLVVFNLPWSMSAPDIENLFSQCGIVKHVEIIKEKGGRNRGFGFVTMASGEDARAVIDRFDSYELEGRIVKVEYAKRMRKPPPTRPPPPDGAVVGETRHKIYVSNLAWKVRSTHLREFFAASCNPVSARVVFDSPSGRSAGYGFVSFTTKDEAEAAIIALDGKELMGRPLRLKVSQKKVDESGETQNEADSIEGSVQES